MCNHNIIYRPVVASFGLALLITMIFSQPGWPAPLVKCTGTTCAISIYSSSSPTTFVDHTLELDIPVGTDGQAIPFPDTSVTMRYDQVASTIACNGTRTPLGTSANSELQNYVTCAMSSQRDSVNLSLELYGQDVYGKSFIDCPGNGLDVTLLNTSVGSPACLNDSTSNAQACKWEEQNVTPSTLGSRGVPLNNWVIFTKTLVTSLTIGYNNNTTTPIYNASQYICSADLNGNGDIEENEVQACVDTADGPLCPINSVPCTIASEPPVCPAGGTYDPVNNRCQANEMLCPDGGTYNSSSNQCVAPPVCPAGTTINASGLCTAPACPSGSTYTSSPDQPDLTPWCIAPTVSYSCSQTFLRYQAECPTGSITLGSDLCIDCGYTPSHRCTWTNKCPSGFMAFSIKFSSTCPVNDVQCVKLVSCPTGTTLDWAGGTCVGSAATCPSEYTINGTSCIAPSACPTGYTLNGTVCTAASACSTADGVFDPVQDVCSRPDACPLGSYACMKNGDTWSCSSSACTQYSEADTAVAIATTEGENDYPSQPFESDGTCNGHIYVFNGEDNRCREKSIYTGFSNCCFTGTEDSCDKNIWLGFSQCNGSERDLACGRYKGRCVRIGSYCSRKILGTCSQREASWCCFSSKLGRIIQEQGRPQLSGFNPAAPFGTAESPDCRGLTPAEFQMLDFNKIDLSEFYSDIKTKSSSEVQNAIQSKTQQFYDKFKTQTPNP